METGGSTQIIGKQDPSFHWRCAVGLQVDGLDSRCLAVSCQAAAGAAALAVSYAVKCLKFFNGCTCLPQAEKS